MKEATLVTYVIAPQFYRSPTRGHPSFRPVSEDPCASLERWLVPSHYLRVTEHIALSLPERAVDLLVERYSS
jgi:hypothetical protein